MARAEASIRIARPPDEVFAVVGDPANNPRWRRNVISTGWLDDRPMRIGRRGRQTARVLGREWTVDAEVVEWDPPRAATWRTVQGPVTVTSWVRVEPDGEGSLVTGGGDGEFSGPLGALLTRLAVPRMVRQADADLRTLREQLEGRDGVSSEAGAIEAPSQGRSGQRRAAIAIAGVSVVLVLVAALILAARLRRGAALGERYGS